MPTTHTTELQALAEQFPIGSSFGRYLITGVLGRGSSAVVLRAVHRTLSVPVALKFVRPSAREKNPNLYEEFKRESQLLARLNHPHIVRVWDFEDHPDHPYIALEYVDGLNLQELLHQAGRLIPERAVEVVRQAVLGLRAAWDLNIIHRDVKPGNILLPRRGGVKLADLGLAVIASQDHVSRSASGTRRDELVGTAAYMAPEQSLSPDAVDYRADIYALGASFYQAVTEQIPFPARNAQEAILKHVTEPLVPPHELCPDLPESLSRLIGKMMEKNPDHRHQSAAELLHELDQLREELRDQPPPEVAQTSTPEPPSAEQRLGQAAQDTLIRSPTPVDSVFDPDEMVTEAIEAARSGRVEEALTLFRAITEIHPSRPEAWVWLGMLSRTPREAVRCFRKLLEQHPAHELGQLGLTKALIDSGIAEAKSGNPVAARGFLRQAVETDPLQERAWLWLARLAENEEQKRKHYRNVLAINPHNAEANEAVNCVGV